MLFRSEAVEEEVEGGVMEGTGAPRRGSPVTEESSADAEMTGELLLKSLGTEPHSNATVLIFHGHNSHLTWGFLLFFVCGNLAKAKP